MVFFSARSRPSRPPGASGQGTGPPPCARPRGATWPSVGRAMSHQSKPSSAGHRPARRLPATCPLTPLARATASRAERRRNCPPSCRCVFSSRSRPSLHRSSWTVAPHRLGHARCCAPARSGCRHEFTDVGEVLPVPPPPCTSACRPPAFGAHRRAPPAHFRANVRAGPPSWLTVALSSRSSPGHVT